MPLPRENAYNLLVRLQKANKLKTKAKQTRTCANNLKQVAPEEQIGGKNPNFDGLGAMFPQFCPDKREIWYGGAEPCQI